MCRETIGYPKQDTEDLQSFVAAHDFEVYDYAEDVRVYASIEDYWVNGGGEHPVQVQPGLEAEGNSDFDSGSEGDDSHDSDYEMSDGSDSDD